MVPLFEFFKRNFLAAVVGAFLLLVAFPTVAYAVPAVTSFSVDSTTISLGQRVTFSVRTTAQTNFVFAEVGGTRVAGTRLATDFAGNQTWQVVVTPTASTNVIIYANSTNTVTGAANIVIPITVTGGVGNVPNAPGVTTTGNTGPLAIISVTETPSNAAGVVQLTIVTGNQVNNVWVRFDGNRYRMTDVPIAQDGNTRTWRIDFPPNTWTTQTVQVSANRSYTVTGATNVNYVLTLAHPFTPAATPVIQNITGQFSNIATNANVTMTIRTNADVDFVWVVDANGREHEARRIGPTAIAARTWEVTFRPERSGNVTVFANRTRSTIGAAQRTESITMSGQRLTINNTNATWTHWATNEATVTVNTNQFANDVWVTMPDGRNITLNRVGTGTGNRTWQATITNVSFPLLIRASENATGRSIDAQHTLWEVGGTGGPSGVTSIINVSSPSHHTRRVGETVTFTVETSSDVTGIMISGTHGSSNWISSGSWSTGRGTLEWNIPVQINSTIPQASVTAWFTVEVWGSGANTETTTTGNVVITR